MTKGKRAATDYNRHAMTFPGIIMESAKRKCNLLGTVRNGIAYTVYLKTFAGSFYIYGYLYALGAVIFPWNRLRKRRKGNMTKKIDTTTIGGRIKSARTNKGLTQQELADQLYIPMTTLSTYENNKAELKGQVVVELANALGVTTDYILTGADNEADAMEQELLAIFRSIQTQNMKKVALEQIRCLAILNED